MSSDGYFLLSQYFLQFADSGSVTLYRGHNIHKDIREVLYTYYEDPNLFDRNFSFNFLSYYQLIEVHIIL